MKITLKDGSIKEYAEAMSAYDIARDISEGLARAACAVEINGEVKDLRTVVDSDCEMNILTAKDSEGLRTVRHTCSHVLAEAVKRLFPNAKLAIGPSIDEGFYYDFESEPFSGLISQKKSKKSGFPGGKECRNADFFWQTAGVCRLSCGGGFRLGLVMERDRKADSACRPACRRADFLSGGDPAAPD